MCFVKTEDISWPHIITGLPTCGKSAKISEGTKRATIALSLEEVYHFRNEVAPVGQCALHMALQRNLPLQVIRIIVESDPSTLMLSDNNGEIPLMTGKCCVFLKPITNGSTSVAAAHCIFGSLTLESILAPPPSPIIA